MPRTNPARYLDPLRATRTRQESARLIGCGDNKVTELFETGVLTVVRIGNRDLATVVSLEKLLGRPIAELEAPLRDTEKSEAHYRAEAAEAALRDAKQEAAMRDTKRSEAHHRVAAAETALREAQQEALAWDTERSEARQRAAAAETATT